jgi:hypothetical protein
MVKAAFLVFDHIQQKEASPHIGKALLRAGLYIL